MNLQNSIIAAYKSALSESSNKVIWKFYDYICINTQIDIDHHIEDVDTVGEELEKINESYFTICELLAELVKMIGEEKS